ncbi:MAG: NfeD family protein [Caldilineales bacterium]|nr:NfeD family protein [Caldilineales bacterium]
MVLNTFVWGWLILAMILFVAEIFTAGFVLAAFGVGALAGALAALFGLSIPVQLIVFVVVSAAAVLLSRRFADRVSGEQPQKVGVDRVLGKQAVVLEAIDPLRAHGMVRVDREEWRAQSQDGSMIPVESVVEVVAVDGTRLIVRQIAAPPES